MTVTQNLNLHAAMLGMIEEKLGGEGATPPALLTTYHIYHMIYHIMKKLVIQNAIFRIPYLHINII